MRTSLLPGLPPNKARLPNFGRRALNAWQSSLDDVDLGGQVARHFEANFLFANLRLAPGLHGIASIISALLCAADYSNIGIGVDNDKSLLCYFSISFSYRRNRAR